MSTGKMAAVLAALAIFGTALGTRVCFAAESELTLCSYYSGGGMSGGHLYMELGVKEDGTARATLDWRETNGAPEIHRAVGRQGVAEFNVSHRTGEITEQERRGHLIIPDVRAGAGA